MLSALSRIPDGHMNLLVQIKGTIETILKKFAKRRNAQNLQKVQNDGFTPGEIMTSLLEFGEMEQRLAAVEYRR